MSAGGIAALIVSGAVVVLVLVLAVPILKLRHTVDAATRAINDLNDRTGPILGNVNTLLDQSQTSLDGVNLQLERLDTITGHAQQVTANVANLTTVVSAAAANPLVKVAAFTYGIRKATASRRRADDEKEVRATLKAERKRRKA